MIRLSPSSKAWARLDQLYDAKQRERIPAYIQPELFHYTTVEGLKGIIESNTLWQHLPITLTIRQKLSTVRVKK